MAWDITQVGDSPLYVSDFACVNYWFPPYDCFGGTNCDGPILAADNWWEDHDDICIETWHTAHMLCMMAGFTSYYSWTESMFYEDNCGGSNPASCGLRADQDCDDQSPEPVQGAWQCYASEYGINTIYSLFCYDDQAPIPDVVNIGAIEDELAPITFTALDPDDDINLLTGFKIASLPYNGCLLYYEGGTWENPSSFQWCACPDAGLALFGEEMCYTEDNINELNDNSGEGIGGSDDAIWDRYLYYIGYPHYNGSDTFGFTACNSSTVDGNYNSPEMCGGNGFAIINIDPVTDAPTCEDMNVEINEGQSATVVFYCTPVGGDVITNWTVSTLTPLGGTITSGCTTVDNCGPAVVFVPTDIDWNESTSFTYTGCAGDKCSESAEVNISAVGQPDAPSGCTGLVDSIGPFNEDSTSNQFTISCTAPSYEAMDYYIVHPADVGTLYVSIDEEDEAITSDTTITGTTATLDYIPLTDQNYDAEFSYFAYATDGGYTYVEATIGITAGADSPACLNDAMTVWEESSSNPLSIACTSPNEYEEITGYEITEDPEHGTLMSDSIPTMFYTPDANFEGADSFEYTATATDGGTTDVVFNITVEDVSDQPIWIYVDTGIGIINEYESTNVTGWAETGAAIYEDIAGVIEFELSPPPGYECWEIFWTVEPETLPAESNGSLDFRSGFGCTNILDLIPNLDWNTYSLDGIDFVDDPVDITITATPTGGDALELTFPISVVPTSDLPLAPDMYVAQNYDDGIGFIFGPQWNQMSFIWHKSGIDTAGQQSECGDGMTGGPWGDNDCIYDPDPYDNNVWWAEEHGWICDGEPEFDIICTGAGSCGSSTCIETTPMYTYLAVMIMDWNNFNHGGDPAFNVPGRCDNALTPLLYTQNVQGGNEEIFIQGDDLPFMFPTVQDTDVPYFMPDVSGDVIDLRLTYQCENWAYDGIWVPYDFEIYYRVVECMYFTTNGGTVHHWGQPYCAESDELDWECDDDNPLKCSADESEMFLSPTIEGSRADFGLGGPGGRSGNSLTFVDQSELEEGETIVTWNWDFGHGEPSNSDNPTHTYPVPEPGEGQKYTVELTIGIDTTGSNTVDEEKIMQREVWIGSISHDADWNMVSVPVEAHDMLYDALFPGAIPGTLYAFDGTYSGQSELLVGKGYWLRFYSAGENIVAGLVPKLGNREIALIELNQEWNLIGGLTFDMDFYNDAYVSDPQGIIVPDTLFGFDGTYIQSSELSPGKGYWIKTNIAGVISIHELVE